MPEPFRCGKKLFVDLDDNARANRTAAFTDSEAEAFLDGDGGNQLNIHLDVIAGHAHLSAFGQRDDAGYVGGAEIELRTIVVEERCMTAAFILGQNINLAAELRVRMNGAGLRKNLAALDLIALNTAKQGADVVASLA